MLEVEGLRKSFGGVSALRDGRFRLERGSVHAFCGGNGAGKSTFLKIVMGILPRDGGTIRLNGRAVSFTSPRDALAAGISIIEQELSPVPAMTVAENVFLGREPVGLFGRIDFAKMNAATSDLMDRLGFSIAPTALMMDLTVAQVQLVEIAKAISYDAEVIIMDEPTSALGEAEADHLFEAIKVMKNEGKGVIYVSHRLTEIFGVADTYTVLRDGAFVEEGRIEDIDKTRLVELIVGRPLTEEFAKGNKPQNEIVLKVEGIDAAHGVRDVSFELRRGEILGFYGLMGSGRTEILERIFGLSPDSVAGRITIEGRNLAARAPRDAIRAGLALVTEDRKGSGLVMTQDVRANACLARLEKLQASPLMMSTSAERDAARRVIDLFGIKTASDRLGVSNLSGGNQQKVVLGKWYLTEPRILLLDEPTRGVDVGAKREIYQIVSDFASEGGAVILVSSEIEEVLGMADRTLVMRDGRVAGILDGAEMTAPALLHLAA
ncbi:sugar ABC transporter ATP-binding protein [Palleronia sediminis]|uniref:Sugar ABC transporter ATP-binding protein n=1 Tax=Palleronia sediminis TaxID=2547833 RepID=A0A4V3B997_9RHOB|nr:sugar ABC transporter ATP-binding protein [Palleronia sediminis]